jgi:seryl-tRNA synthetase
VLDIKLIREKTDFVRQRLATRGAGDEAKIDELLKLDEAAPEISGRSRNAQIPAQPREQGNRRADGAEKKIAEAEAKKAETKDLGEKISALDKQAAEAKRRATR